MKLASTFLLAGSLAIASAQNTTTPVFTDYAYVYFAHEVAQGEQVRMAVTNNGDLNSWTLLKNGAPYLTSNLGTKGIRDPSLIISPNRDKFWIIATDLCVYCAGGWGSPAANNFTSAGSKAIIVWESTDGMKTWSAAASRTVTPSNFGMTWAPDAIWDKTRNQYLVFWTSSGGNIGWGQLKAYTADFKTFTSAETAWSIGMDNTIAFDDSSNRYYMITKNGPNELIEQRWSSTLGSSWTVVKNQIGSGSMPKGEGPLIFRDIKDKNKWHLWIDNYMRGTGYLPFETTNLAAADWKQVNLKLPPTPRHGYVVPITAQERANILGQ